jgi:hypothetical protein
MKPTIMNARINLQNLRNTSIQEYLSDTGLRWLKISDATKTSSPFLFDIKEHIKNPLLAILTSPLMSLGRRVSRRDSRVRIFPRLKITPSSPVLIAF